MGKDDPGYITELAAGEFLRIYPDYLNSRDELVRAAASLGSLLRLERTAG